MTPPRQRLSPTIWVALIAAFVSLAPATLTFVYARWDSSKAVATAVEAKAVALKIEIQTNSKLTAAEERIKALEEVINKLTKKP